MPLVEEVRVVVEEEVANQAIIHLECILFQWHRCM